MDSLEGIPIVTQFDPPVGMSPMMVGILIDGKANDQDFIAGLLDLISRGIMRIDEVQDAYAREFQVFLLQDIAQISDPLEHFMVESFFGSRGTRRMSELTFAFRMERARYRFLSKGHKVLLPKMYEIGIWGENPFPKSGCVSVFKNILWVYLWIILGVIVWAGCASYFYENNFMAVLQDFGIKFMFIAPFIFAPLFVFSLIVTPSLNDRKLKKKLKIARTEKGEEVYRHILGYKKYLLIAQKERILFDYRTLEDIYKNPKEALYAVALGIVEVFPFMPDLGTSVSGRIVEADREKKFLKAFFIMAGVFILIIILASL